MRSMLMKCPYCGMNIRDNTLVCGYCGENIPQQPQKKTDSAGRQKPSSAPSGQKAAVPAKSLSDDGETMEEEEEGGLSPYLQPGEQVLIGSLNVSVKKFFFHAYLTDKRIFLIDTQEKKLKVTAKDVPRNTIAGSIIEFSENSDPVLVLSIRSADDEIKTMKIVFVQNGMDRSAEIDEWITLLNKEEKPVAPKRPAAAPEPTDFEEKPVPAKAELPIKSQELKPAKKPAKHLEKQPPVKRLISVARSPEAEVSPEAPPVSPPRRTQVRQVMEPVKKVPVVMEPEREIPPVSPEKVPEVRKPEVQSAMKVAMKSAMKPLAQPPVRPAKREVTEHVMRRPIVEPGPSEPVEPPRRPKIQEKVREPAVQEEPAEVPQFCHNCGKKLPLEANFCPGCGTRLGQNRTLPGSRFSSVSHERRTMPADTVTPDRKPGFSRAEEPDEDEIEDEKPQPTKPPVKRAPKGSEMTILHKFLRR